MGQVFELGAPYFEESPNKIEGFKHWVQYNDQKEVELVGVVITFKEDATELTTKVIRITRALMMEWGATPSEWMGFLAAAANSSDTDDVTEMCSETAWGLRCLWLNWRRLQGA